MSATLVGEQPINEQFEKLNPPDAEALGIIEKFTDAELQTAIEIADSEADTYLTAHYVPPLTGYPKALKKHHAAAVFKHLMDVIGRSPLGDDSLIDDNYKAALAFYKALQKSEQHLPDAGTTPAAGAVVHVASGATSSGGYRGW